METNLSPHDVSSRPNPLFLGQHIAFHSNAIQSSFMLSRAAQPFMILIYILDLTTSGL